MKIRTPRTKVANSVPARLLTCFAAHFPKAAAAPVEFTSATMIPRITRNMKMPALSEIAGVKPSVIIASRVPTGLKPATNSAPTSMPMNSEL